jgi:hypothetical protein
MSLIANLGMRLRGNPGPVSGESLIACAGGRERQSPGHKISTEVATGPKSTDKSADSVAKTD